LFIPEKALPCWDPFGSRAPSDYDRACESTPDGIGVISVCGHDAVVFGGIDTMSTWLPARSGCGGDVAIPLEWGHRFTDEEIQSGVSELDDSSFVSCGVELCYRTERVLLMSALDEPPHWLGDHIEVEMRGGQYSISEADVELRSGIRCLVYRFLNIQDHRARD
jgi:hypothetical protein